MRSGRFEVRIDGVEAPGFRVVDIPSRSTETEEYREGNDAEYEKKTWGQPTYDDLEMERGLAPDANELFEWRRAVEAGKADEGRKEIAVILLDEEGEPRIRWEFSEAWPAAYDPPTLDAGADGDVATESVTVVFDKMVRTEA